MKQRALRCGWLAVRPRPSRRVAANGLATCPVAVLLAIVPGQAQVEERDVNIAGLVASHVRPAASDRAPIAVILAGSGPTDRNGNSGATGIKTDTYKLLAHALAGARIASLRYDKRGVGASAGFGIPEPDLRIGVFADDAATVAVWAAEQPGSGPVVLIGHSEGGLVALLAAGRARVKAIVLLAAPGRPLAAILREQFGPTRLPLPLAAASTEIIASLERGEQVANVRPELAAAFRPSVQPYLIDLMRIDPVRQVQGVDVPVMVVGGGRDIQVSRSDFDALAGARPGLTTHWDPTMGHTLKPVSDDPRSQLLAYTDPTIPLADGLAAGIAAFIRRASSL